MAFDLQVYLGGGTGRRCTTPRNLYSWHYRHGPSASQFTYTPFAALLFAAGPGGWPFPGADGAGCRRPGRFGLAGHRLDRLARGWGWRSLPARAGATLLVTGLAFWTEAGCSAPLYLGPGWSW